MCNTILSIWLCQARNKTYHKVLFSFEKFRTEQIVDSICQPQRLEITKHKLHHSRWKVKFKMVDESHTNKTFQGAAKNTIIVTTNH